MKLWIAPFNKVFVKDSLIDELDFLDSLLSYQVDTTHMKLKYNWDGVVHLFNRTKLFFSVGLLARVTNELTARQVQFTIVDARTMTPEHNIEVGESVMDLREYQTDSAVKALEYVNSILQVAVGGGKTFIGCKFIEMTKKRTLIVVPTVSLIEQWKSSLIKCFPKYAPDLIGIYGAGDKDVKPITIATYQSLSYDPKLLKAYENYFKTVIYDECHSVSAKTWKQIQNMFHTYYSLGLSATAMSRGEGQNLLVESVCGPMITNVSASELTRAGYLSKVNIWLCEGVQEKTYRYHTYDSIIQEAIVDNTLRNKQIVTDAMLPKFENRVKLILVERTQQGVNLQTLFKELFHVDVLFLTGKNKRAERDDVLRRMRLAELKLVIATRIFEQGIDVPNLSVLLLASPTKSAVKTIQRVGRITRLCDVEQMFVFDYVDNVKYLIEHAQERFDLYRQEEEWHINNRARFLR